MENQKKFYNKNLVILDTIFFSFLLFCVIFSSFEILSYFTFFGFYIYLVILTFKKPAFTVKYFIMILGAVLTINGTAMIEFTNNRYLAELQYYSSYVGSLPLYIMAWWIFLKSFYYYDVLYCDDNVSKLQNSQNKTYNVLNILSIVSLLVYIGLFLQVASHPAFLLGIDRFAYFQLYPLNWFWEKIDHIAGILLLFPLMSIIYGRKAIGLMAMFFYVLYYLWNGNKFGPFMTILCIFLFVYYPNMATYTKKRIRKIIISATGMCLGIIVLTFGLVYHQGVDMENYIWQRASQQGQLWWRTYSITNGDTHVQEFGDEILGIIAGPLGREDLVGANNSIYKIMYLCAPEALIDAKLETGSRYTEAGMAALYYYFGLIGVIISSAFMGIIIAATLNNLLKNIKYGNYITALILLRFFMIERTFLSMFTMADFFKPLSLISYLYLFIMWNKIPHISLQRGIFLKLRRI